MYRPFLDGIVFVRTENDCIHCGASIAYGLAYWTINIAPVLINVSLSRGVLFISARRVIIQHQYYILRYFEYAVDILVLRFPQISHINLTLISH